MNKIKKLASVLMSRDLFGHPISLNFKGSEAFPTKLGAFISIGIQGLVLVFLALKLIAMVDMADPQIISYQRPIKLDELSERGEMKLDELNFNYGVFIQKKGEF